MPEQVDVYYDGWSEHWRWGTLVSSTALTGRPLILFEYSDEAMSRRLELSARNAGDIIDRICAVAGNFTAKAESLFPGQITQDTMRTIQGRINDNINRLR